MRHAPMTNYKRTTASNSVRPFSEVQKNSNPLSNELLATLAHELRNPLASILNALPAMHQDRFDEPAARQARDIVERQAQHMARIIDDLLDVCRSAHGKLFLYKEPTDLAAVVASAIESVGPLLTSRGHHLTVSLPLGPVALLADASRLKQVLTNLLTNAAKYTEPGGQIWLTAEHRTKEVVLRVRDTGIGIAPETLPCVFDLFAQGQRSLEDSRSGLGIGLTLVRNFVEAHGGSVSAFSAGLDRGSEFVVRLPARAEALSPRSARPGRDAEHSKPAARQLRVLVVDDNKDAARSLAMVLQLWGHEVHTVDDGPTTLEAVRIQHPDVVLMDIHLPGMDGWQVARRLRQQESREKLLLVALTGYGQDEDRRRSEEAGFDLHLVKPLHPLQLQELLARVCR